jgi:dienelactone hydrolase
MQSKVMDKSIQIKTSDNKIIFATLRGSFNKPLIILVHGLASNMNEALHYNAARYFEKQGFSSLRMNLYSWQKGARKLHECTFTTHAKDIDTALEYASSKGAKKIFLVGHSYGWPSILHTKNHKYVAVTAWDGSILPKNSINEPTRSKIPKGRIIDEGYFVIVGEQMAKDSQKINSIDLVKNFTSPISFITVDDNVEGNLEGNKKMCNAASVKKELIIIKGARHNFFEEGKQEKLYKSTVNWFNKFV